MFSLGILDNLKNGRKKTVLDRMNRKFEIVFSLHLYLCIFNQWDFGFDSGVLLGEQQTIPGWH